MLRSSSELMFSFVCQADIFCHRERLSSPTQDEAESPASELHTDSFHAVPLETLIPLFVNLNQERGGTIQVRLDRVPGTPSPPYRNLGRDTDHMLSAILEKS